MGIVIKNGTIVTAENEFKGDISEEKVKIILFPERHMD